MEHEQVHTQADSPSCHRHDHSNLLPWPLPSVLVMPGDAASHTVAPYLPSLAVPSTLSSHSTRSKTRALIDRSAIHTQSQRVPSSSSSRHAGCLFLPMQQHAADDECVPTSVANRWLLVSLQQPTVVFGFRVVPTAHDGMLHRVFSACMVLW